MVVKAGTFQGFRCQVALDGKEGAGTENLVAIVSTVKCAAVAANNLAYLARRKLLSKHPNVTGVVAITHESGCSLPDGSKGQATKELLRILIRVMNHPNIRAIFLLGLGCEHLTPCLDVPENITPLLESQVIDFKQRVIADVLQRFSSEIRALNSIINGPLNKLFIKANKYKRESIPLSYLTLGLKCGGSDGYSGTCANPALGVAVDRLVSAGGAAIITETPELAAAIPALVKRARDKKIARWLNGLLPRFDRVSHKYPIPGQGRQFMAPGNKIGGLRNALVKSAAAAKKSGSARVEGVLEYGDSIYTSQRRGLWVLDCPSYDQISTPGLGLSGAQIIAFTTGLGTPIGSAISQVVKIGNRHQMGLKEHVDYFADGVIKGRTIEAVGEDIFELIIAIASGEKRTKVAVLNDKMFSLGMSEMHQEFMPWKRWGDN